MALRLWLIPWTDSFFYPTPCARHTSDLNTSMEGARGRGGVFGLNVGALVIRIEFW